MSKSIQVILPKTSCEGYSDSVEEAESYIVKLATAYPEHSFEYEYAEWLDAYQINALKGGVDVSLLGEYKNIKPRNYIVDYTEDGKERSTMIIGRCARESAVSFKQMIDK